jgi:surfactin synthase thioesterase subunit
MYGFRSEACWLNQRLDPSGDTHLFCFPSLGSSATEYASWPRSVGSVRISILRFPTAREPGWWRAHPTFQSQAADLVDDIGRSLPDRFAFFGHGDAALLAYETVVELARRRMTAPTRLVVSASPAPQDAFVEGPLPAEDELVEKMLATSLQLHCNPLPSILNENVRALRGQAIARRRYRVLTPERLDCEITVLCWSETAGLDRSAMGGWSECAEALFVILDGGEFSYAEPAALLKVIASLGGKER